MSESFRTPETVTTLLIDCMPIQNKKLRKKKSCLFAPRDGLLRSQLVPSVGNVHSPSAKLCLQGFSPGCGVWAAQEKAARLTGSQEGRGHLLSARWS